MNKWENVMDILIHFSLASNCCIIMKVEKYVRDFHAFIFRKLRNKKEGFY